MGIINGRSHVPGVARTITVLVLCLPCLLECCAISRTVARFCLTSQIVNAAILWEYEVGEGPEVDSVCLQMWAI